MASGAPDGGQRAAAHKLKTFSHVQIERKVAERAGDVPQYAQLLMEAAVRRDADGVTFDTQHASWRTLVRLVRAAVAVAAEQQQQEQKEKEKDPPRSPAPSSAHIPASEALTPGSQQLRVLKQEQLRTRSAGDRALLLQVRHELASAEPNVPLVRDACRQCGVPDEHRAEVWRLLLLSSSSSSPPPPSASLQAALAADALPLANQRVVQADVDRTLTHLETFRADAVRARMERVLAAYCRLRCVSYKQGMNYLLAPLLLVGDSDDDDEALLRRFDCFIALLLPNTFTDNDFGGLQCVFALFRLLLLYHAPRLACYLDEYDMGPELYASSWFLTLFANRTQVDVLVALWDGLLLEAAEDARLHYFVSLALLISLEQHIVDEDPVHLPQLLAGIRIESRAQVSALLHSARLLYRAHTPASARDTLASITTRHIVVDSLEWTRLTSSACLAISALEIVQQQREKEEEGLAFFLLDCRRKAAFDAGHLPHAHHLDPDILAHPARLAKRVNSLRALSGRHFCFITDGKLGAAAASAASGAAMLCLYFLHQGFRYVSRCDGGFHAVHKLAVSTDNDIALEAHNPPRCAECSPAGGPSAAAHASGGRGFFSTIKTLMRRDKREEEVTAQVDVEKQKHKQASPRIECPDGARVVSPTNEVILLLTALRQRTTAGRRLFACVERLVALVLGDALGGVELVEEDVSLDGNRVCRGVRAEAGVCGIAASHPVEGLLLRRALDPFADVPQVSLALADMPADAAARCALVLSLVLDDDSEHAVLAVLEGLLELGVYRTTLCCVVASQETVGRVLECIGREHLQVVAAAMDRVVGDELDPGVGRLHSRLDGYAATG